MSGLGCSSMLFDIAEGILQAVALLKREHQMMLRKSAQKKAADNFVSLIEGDFMTP